MSTNDDGNKCDKCAAGTMRLTQGPGRTFRGANNTLFPIPDSLVLYECIGCGARMLNGAAIDALALAEENYRATLALAEENYRARFEAPLDSVTPLALTATEARVAYRYLKSAADFLKNRPRTQDDARVLNTLVEKLHALGASKRAV